MTIFQKMKYISEITIKNLMYQLCKMASSLIVREELTETIQPFTQTDIFLNRKNTTERPIYIESYKKNSKRGKINFFAGYDCTIYRYYSNNCKNLESPQAFTKQHNT